MGSVLHDSIEATFADAERQGWHPEMLLLPGWTESMVEPGSHWHGTPVDVRGGSHAVLRCTEGEVSIHVVPAIGQQLEDEEAAQHFLSTAQRVRERMQAETADCNAATRLKALPTAEDRRRHRARTLELVRGCVLLAVAVLGTMLDWPVSLVLTMGAVGVVFVLAAVRRP